MSVYVRDLCYLYLELKVNNTDSIESRHGVAVVIFICGNMVYIYKGHLVLEINLI